MAQALEELTGEARIDPDAQATVNDFLDYTEFFPSDLARSLSLIRKLDESYQQDTLSIHELTKTYGSLPTLPVEERPNPQALRNSISTTLDRAINSRESAFAEATRLCDSADTLYHRLFNITKKLKALPKPPSRDPSPVPQARSPNTSRTRKGDADKAPKITLVVDSHRPGSSSRQSNGAHRQKYSSRRVIIPGEVLPPFDPDSPGAEISSDSESEPPSPVRVSTQTLDKLPKHLKVEKLKLPKVQKQPITPRPPRTPGLFGTNVHSGVAGISVSNAMALLERPPENPEPGSIHAPWNDLTEWELNMIRKRMKKNAVWQPSDTMKQRELASMGRGKANYEKAKARAEANGEEFLSEIEPGFARRSTRENQGGTDFSEEHSQSLLNKGMKLNEAKKLKRENQAAQAQEDFLRQIAQAQSDLVISWGEMAQLNKQVEALSTPNESQKKLGQPSRKRKQKSSTGDTEGKTTSNDTPPFKKLKISHAATSTSEKSYLPDIESPVTTTTETASPTKAPATAPPLTLKNTSEKEPDTPTMAFEAPPSAPPKTLSLTLPKEKMKQKGKDKDKIPAEESTEEEANTEQSSRRSTLRLKANSASADTTNTPSEATKESPAPTTSTPAQTAASRREKRPAPGPIVLSTSDSGTKISLGKPKKQSTPAPVATGKRTSLNSKETGAPKQASAPPVTKQEVVEDDEEHYCLCGGVSEGPMVACDNDCEKAWFHWACVGMTEMPRRTQKWYCPECREALGVTENGVPVPGKSKKKAKAR